MTIETKILKYPVYTVRAKVQTQGTSNEIGTYLDVDDGVYLGLLFTGREEALRFMKRNALGAEDDIFEIPTESRLVQLARRLRDEGTISTIVFDYGVFGDEVTALPVEELCRRHIPEDDIESHGPS